MEKQGVKPECGGLMITSSRVTPDPQNGAQKKTSICRRELEDNVARRRGQIEEQLLDWVRAGDHKVGDRQKCRLLGAKKRKLKKTRNGAVLKEDWGVPGPFSSRSVSMGSRQVLETKPAKRTKEDS